MLESYWGSLFSEPQYKQDAELFSQQYRTLKDKYPEVSFYIGKSIEESIDMLVDLPTLPDGPDFSENIDTLDRTDHEQRHCALSSTNFDQVTAAQAEAISLVLASHGEVGEIFEPARLDISDDFLYAIKQPLPQEMLEESLERMRKRNELYTGNFQAIFKRKTE